MDVESAAKSCRAVGHRLDAARAELLAIGDLDWTGRAAGVYASVLDEAVRGVGRLRADADDALHAVERHVAAVHLTGCGCP